MQRHTNIYMRFFGYSTSDFIPCEVCGTKATEVHHIDARGMGGDPTGKKDVIENLMAVCRTCHNEYGDIPDFMEYLCKIHSLRMLNK